MKRRFLSKFLRQFTLMLLLVPFFAQVGLADTLYERSMAQFKVRALRAAPDDFTFVVLGDSRDGDPIFKKTLRLARSYDPLFILHGGDYSESGGEAETARFLSLVKESLPDIPLFVVRGNHELNREVFAKQVGPFHFTLESKRLGLSMVALDNADNVLTPAELDYLRSRLASAGRASFVAMHVPPKTKRWIRHTFSEGADTLSDILAKSRVRGVFFSHQHLFDRSEFGGVPAFITGGAGAPLVFLSFHGERVHHILVVRVKDGKASFTMVPLPDK